jgi:hypothetical protein
MKPKGVCIAKKSLEHGFENNSNGAGFAVATGGKLQIYKGFFKFDEFWDTYKEFQNQTALVHFRIRTSGKTDEYNCHPFEVCDGRFALIHNGVISIKQEDKDKSDTAHFAELVLTPLLERIPFDHPALKYLIEEAIGAGNKIVLLRRDGKHAIFNEDVGHWNKGAWFSNSSYKYAKYGTTSYSSPGAWNREYAQGSNGYWLNGEFVPNTPTYSPSSAEKKDEEGKIYSFDGAFYDEAGNEVDATKVNGPVEVVDEIEAWRMGFGFSNARSSQLLIPDRNVELGDIPPPKEWREAFEERIRSEDAATEEV